MCSSYKELQEVSQKSKFMLGIHAPLLKHTGWQGTDLESQQLQWKQAAYWKNYSWTPLTDDCGAE